MSSFVVWSPLNTAKQESLTPCRSNGQKTGHNIYKTFPVAFTPALSWSSKLDGSWYIAWENSWHFASLPLGSACFWLVEAGFQPTRSATLVWVVTRHQHGISALVSWTLFRGETIGGFENCRLFSQASWYLELQLLVVTTSWICGKQYNWNNASFAEEWKN